MLTLKDSLLIGGASIAVAIDASAAITSGPPSVTSAAIFSLTAVLGPIWVFQLSKHILAKNKRESGHKVLPNEIALTQNTYQSLAKMSTAKPSKTFKTTQEDVMGLYKKLLAERKAAGQLENGAASRYEMEMQGLDTTHKFNS